MPNTFYCFRNNLTVSDLSRIILIPDKHRQFITNLLRSREDGGNIFLHRLIMFIASF